MFICLESELVIERTWQMERLLVILLNGGLATLRPIEAVF